MPQPITNLVTKTKVKDTGTTLYGAPIIWLVADKNHAGYPANSVTLVTERIIKIMGVDGKEASNPDSSRKDYGNNRYTLANLPQWLNKAGSPWYVAAHSYDAPPSAGNVTYNAFDNTAGFLSGFSVQMLSSMLDTTLTVARATVDGGGSEAVIQKVFLLSKAEVGLGSENGINEGSILPLFTTANASRLCMPTAQAVSNSGYTSSSLNASANWYWWLRSPYASSSYGVRLVGADGSEGHTYAYNGHYGLRPAFNLKSEIMVSDAPDTDGAYVIIWNEPPTTPPSLNVPSAIVSGTNAAISWNASTDPDNDPLTYELEVGVNGGAYSNIYSGANLTYNHAITMLMNTVQYRVRAKDTSNAYSGWQTSATITVIHSLAPEISGQDTDLGVITAPLTIGFTITDPDEGDTVDAEILLNNNVVMQIKPVVLGQAYTYELPIAHFLSLPYGQHKLEIKATDNHGVSAVRTYTFTRIVTKVDIQLKPIQTTERAQMIIVSVQFFADPADVKITVCNNALDDNPTWEATGQGVVHEFTNTVKTANKWAISARVTITPTEHVPFVYCQGITGVYI